MTPVAATGGRWNPPCRRRAHGHRDRWAGMPRIVRTDALATRGSGPTPAPLASPFVPEFRAPDRHPRRPAARVAPGGRPSSTVFADVVEAGRVRPRDPADVRGRSRSSTASVRPPTSSARRCTTSRTRAVVASPCAPSSTASVVRAFVEHRPPPPWKVWYVGAELPLRAAPDGPLPPVRPGRRRGRSAPTTPTSTSRSSPSAWRLLPSASGCGRSPLHAQLARRRRRPRPLRSTRSRPYFRAAPPTLSEREPRDARRATRCGCSTPSAPRTRR